MKSGWKTTEFWQALIAQALALLTLLGVISAGESGALEEALSKCVVAVFALTANGLVVVHYIKSRLALKAMDMDAGGGDGNPDNDPKPTPIRSLKSKAGCIALALVLIGGTQAYAQSLLPWRSGVMQQLREHEQKLNQLHGPQQAPPATPIIVVPPLQTLPIQGQPQQAFPIQGSPKQDFPIPGTPKQDLPNEGQPQQQLPIPGQPQQQLPIQGPTPALPPAAGRQGPQTYSVQRALAQPIK